MLLADIRRRNDEFSQRHIVVFQKYHLDLVMDRFVVVNHHCQSVDEFNGPFRLSVSWRRLAAENEGSGRQIHIRIFPQPVIQVHDMEGVHRLALVAVNPFDLGVEDGIRVDVKTVPVFDIARQ